MGIAMGEIRGNERVERAMQEVYVSRHVREESRGILDRALGVSDEGMIAEYAVLLARFAWDGATPGLVYLDMLNSTDEQVFYCVLDGLARTVIESGEIAPEDGEYS